MKLRRSILALGLAALTACLPLFGATGAMLSPMAGTVAVNGQAVTAGSAIVAGDVVATSAGASARMVLPGGSLIAAANTNFRMLTVNGASQIRLTRGLVKVSGRLPVALNAGTVVPATARTRFNVIDLAGKIYVQTLAGSVAVKFATSTTTVAAGNAVTFADPAPQTGAAAAIQSPGSAGIPFALVAGVALGSGLLIYSIAHKKNTVTSPAQ